MEKKREAEKETSEMWVSEQTFDVGWLSAFCLEG